MDRINTAQLEIGRDRWQAMGALSKFDTLGGMAALKCPVLMLYGEQFIYGKHRALLHRSARRPRSRSCRRPLLHELGARHGHAGHARAFLL
jgi:hypothetical protein